MRVSKIIMAVGAIALLGVGVFFIYSDFMGDVDVIINPEVTVETMTADQEDAIMRHILFGEETEQGKTENGYDLDAQIASMADVQIKGKYKRTDETVVCKITAPDVYSYLMNNIDELNHLEAEELYKKVLEYVKSADCTSRTVEVEVPATYEDGKLIVDTDSVIYQDAVNGGMNSALTEIYITIIREMEKNNEEG